MHCDSLVVGEDGKGYVQAGAGIVADSVPEMEHHESLNKAQAVIRAIEQARELTVGKLTPMSPSRLLCAEDATGRSGRRG